LSTFTGRLEWRKATKGFLADQRTPADLLEKIYDSIHMAPSSFGLQPFYVQVVADQPTKEKLKAAGWNQSQFTTATAVLVFVARTDIKTRITEFVNLIKDTSPERAATIGGYEKMMRDALESRSEQELISWASRQAYIALGFAMAACAELGVDSCPMEGFSPKDFNEILRLPENHHAVVALTVGKVDPKAQHLPKLRFAKQDIIRQ
jgi:nitroreductase / dihydropteridine reductase